MSDQIGVLREGFRRAWHYQRVLWFVFFISLVMGHFAASPAIHKLDWSVDHSLRSHRLTDMFDVGAFSELSSNPEVRLFEVLGGSVSYSLVFFVGFLFLTGGILEAYRADRKLTTREFFEACGSYFWRIARLLLISLVFVIPVVLLASTARAKSGDMMVSAAQEKLGFWLLLVDIVVCGFLLVCIRIWFDIAQIHMVVEEELGVLRAASRALRQAFRNFGSLFWLYIRISVVNWAIFALGIWTWTKMPPNRSGWTFFVLEVVLLAGFATRLWQRASEMVWYQRRFLVPAIMAPAPVVPPVDPLLTIAPATPPIPQG